MTRAQAGALLGASLVAALCVVALVSSSPPPTAEVPRGSEDAFASGLYMRELPPRQPPLRWTTTAAVFRFAHTGGVPAILEVRVRAQRSPVFVEIDGVQAGRLEVGETGRDFLVGSSPRPERVVALRCSGFRAGDGRVLGAQLDRVSLRPTVAPSVSPRLLLVVWIAALSMLGAGLVAGLRPLAALGVSAGATVLLTLALRPCGLAFSPYATTLSILVAFSAWASLVFARLFRGRGEEASPRAAFLAALVAVAVQGIAATSPLMVVSDVGLNANKLIQVSGGDWFPTSFTQHSPPFRIPYGVSFYALLVPFARLGLDPVSVVRAGAAVSGVLGALVVFALVAKRGAWRALAAVAILQFLPGTFERFSYGNLPNVFGQAMTTAFFAWWAGPFWGALVGAATFVLAGLGHLSSLIVLAVLALALVVARWPAIRADRTRMLGMSIGLVLCALYFSRFLPLIAAQLPRLMEGGRAGAVGASPGLVGAVRLQALSVLGQFGVPAILLAIVGRPRPGREALDRDLVAYWAAGAVLAVFAIVSPLSVRATWPSRPSDS